MDGYPGVYICVKGDNMGKIIDHRTHSQAPSFENLKAKSCQELQGLLIKVRTLKTSPSVNLSSDNHVVLCTTPTAKALQTQREQLLEHEGPNSIHEKPISKDLVWAQKFNGSPMNFFHRQIAAMCTNIIYSRSRQRGQGAMSPFAKGTMDSMDRTISSIGKDATRYAATWGYLFPILE